MRPKQKSHPLTQVVLTGRAKKTMGADLPQDRRPCLYLSSPMEN